MKIAYLVAGLGYGDEGKGSTVDFLSRKFNAQMIVRYNGGPQAGHHVVATNKDTHRFAQIGASFCHGIRTHLSHYMLIDPLEMMMERENLKMLGLNPTKENVTVDWHALLITPYHRAINRVRAKRSGKKNTCGMGVGVAKEWQMRFGGMVPTIKDIMIGRDQIKYKMDFLRTLAIEELYEENEKEAAEACPESVNQILSKEYGGYILSLYRDWTKTVTMVPPWWIEEELAKVDTVIFEGAQGVLLDERYGTDGFNTWTDTTFNNALEILEHAGYNDVVDKVGVIRSYYTRHGDGPFQTEAQEFDFIPEKHNSDDGYQGKFRRGVFDVNMFEKAIAIVDGLDTLVINHMDAIELLPLETQGKLEEAITLSEAKHLIIGYGPTAFDKTYQSAGMEALLDGLTQKGEWNGEREFASATGRGIEFEGAGGGDASGIDEDAQGQTPSV